MPTVASRPAPRPPLKWAEGKRWQVPHLQPLWQPHGQRRLVEPFCGGLAVALGLQPERALLNDLNSHLITFYLWLQRGLTIDIAMENQERAFKGGFSWDDQERTARWLASHPGPVPLVNLATPRIERLYRTCGFDVAFLDAPV
jgi:D12 class N6 adenine-specific DNA methyltransferase